MALLALVATLTGNYLIHRRRLRVCPDGCQHLQHATICALARRYLPQLVADALVVGVFAWLLPHVHTGYRPRPLKETS
jgi:hypothetical protein